MVIDVRLGLYISQVMSMSALSKSPKPVIDKRKPQLLISRSKATQENTITHSVEDMSLLVLTTQTD